MQFSPRWQPGNVFAFLICPAEGSTVTWMLLWCCMYTGNMYRGNHWFSFFYLCFDEHAGCKITSRFLLEHKGNSNLLINEAASLTPAPVPGVGAWKKKKKKNLKHKLEQKVLTKTTQMTHAQGDCQHFKKVAQTRSQQPAHMLNAVNLCGNIFNIFWWV